MSDSKYANTDTFAQPIATILQHHEWTRLGLLIHAHQKTEFVVIERGKPVVLGRAPVEGVSIPDGTLSREHARFMLDQGVVHVVDLASKNGIYMRKRRVQQAVLDVGDEVLLGAVRVRIQPVGSSSKPIEIDSEARFRQYLDARGSPGVERRPFAFLHLRAIDAKTGQPSLFGIYPLLDEIRQRLRPDDRIGLYGQDAVQVVLPDTTLEVAQTIAQRLAGPVPHFGEAFVMGVVMHAGASMSTDQLIECAHDAMQKASLDDPVRFYKQDAFLLEDEDVTNQNEVVAGSRMREVLDVVARVASSRLPVILLGETGTGKEVIARLIHERSPRKSRRIVRVNCGAIPKDLVESTLFGHERGAFTGAHQLQKGVFEEADKGTVFLDEVGELPASAQAVLLRVLETGCFARVGSTREIEVDVRIVAATHRNLDAMVAGNQFREDLYYRLSGAVIEIPSLAERAEDIEAFARRFLRLANESNGRNIQGIRPDAMEHLQTYGWPGNVRELRNTIERAVVVARGPMIGPDDLPARVRGEAPPIRMANTVPGADVDAGSSPTMTMPAVPRVAEMAPVRDKVQGYEAELLRSTLESVGWNRAEAAKRMGIPLRTLSYRMNVLGIKKPTL